MSLRDDGMKNLQVSHSSFLHFAPAKNSSFVIPNSSLFYYFRAKVRKNRTKTGAFLVKNLPNSTKWTFFVLFLPTLYGEKGVTLHAKSNKRLQIKKKG